jgi:hypothetical protein
MDMVAILKQNYRYGASYVFNERYEMLLRELWTIPLTSEIVFYLCEQIDNPKTKHDCDLRFIHLRPFLLNPTTPLFDLKEFFLAHLQKCRRIWLKLFYIEAFAKYVGETDIEPIMHHFDSLLDNQHDYIDFEQILSVVGLPLLKDRHGYACFSESLVKAKSEYLKIDPLLRGVFTLNTNYETINLLQPDEYRQRMKAFCEKQNPVIVNK